MRSLIGYKDSGQEVSEDVRGVIIIGDIGGTNLIKDYHFGSFSPSLNEITSEFICFVFGDLSAPNFQNDSIIKSTTIDDYG
ncbi:hypothetical protein QR98_0041830 [Sarcoptes scabiei]|uniref:Uncharacterized protein n=1 Tax=Sarcoptes scabiei TaxID=52283 RepID=A0A132A467_SARSC|nr:hypothetical protein QR98_0041830 [Sarcoptes scabiei]